jgi:hypothetical protein
MLRKILIMLTICVLLISACSPKAAEPPKPTDTAGQAAAPQATEVSAPTEVSKPVNTPQFTEVPKPSKSKPVLYLTSAKGQVEVRPDAKSDFAPGKVGQKLGEGAEIRTGTDSVAVLYRDKTSMVIVDSKSEVLVKQVAFKAGKPITLVSLKSGAAAVDHKGELPEGAVLAVEAPDKSSNGVLHSTIRVSYNPETKLMTAVCTSGECNLVKGDQSLTLKQGQAVDVEGLAPLPEMPEEMTTDQANEFLAMADQICDCQLTLGEIQDLDLEELSPPDDEVPTAEEDLENSADEDGNTVEEDSSPDEDGSEITPPEDGGETPPDGSEAPLPDGNDPPPPDGGGDEAPPSDGGGG